jgi:hypothetical protein
MCNEMFPITTIVEESTSRAPAWKVVGITEEMNSMDLGSGNVFQRDHKV